ncbi:hypothetical protein [Rhizobium rhizogenes]|uniref:hypothetical protein n=1 Tax=Rhizobium rhizogenes TaxID=359 RepID=UPI001574E841|nr:hypothetical protein [Rhizobium rhizogenes]
MESNNDARHDTSNSRMCSPTEHRSAFSPVICGDFDLRDVLEEILLDLERGFAATAVV